MLILTRANMEENKTNLFNTEEYVNKLLEEGANIPCEETFDKFKENQNLPTFYDKQLYERGRQFYYDNIFALFYGKFLGLLSILSIPSILNILILTNMSSTPMTAYKRYMSTIFHMCIWYESDFSPGSKLWQSLKEVRGKHNSASKRGCSLGLSKISQKDMALTQFGFMGYALAKQEKIGLHNIKEEDWQGFVHIWRVVGALLGIEDRFNICRESYVETRQICTTLLKKVFKLQLEEKNQDFVDMGTNLINGMWAMNPTLNVQVLLFRVHYLAHNCNEFNNNVVDSENFTPIVDLTLYQRIIVRMHIFTMWSLQFTIFRLFHNYVHYLALWLMKVCPFLAYYKFGYANSHVNILSSRQNDIVDVNINTDKND